MDFCLGVTLHRHLINGNCARLGPSRDINGYFLMIICAFCYIYFTSFKITYLKLHFGKVKQQECHMGGAHQHSTFPKQVAFESACLDKLHLFIQILIDKVFF